jgi:LmbE family N-acetylglucosaminyl deacetylase
MAWTKSKWDAYQTALKKLTAKVDGTERQAAPWPDWAVTTVVDTADHWTTVWRAVSCHQTQMSVYRNLAELPAGHHRALWGSQEFYRVFSLVNGGRRVESDLFEGLARQETSQRTSRVA